MNDKYRFILERLESAGYQANLVGGCVRDYIMGREVHDYDITTDALPERIMEVFGDIKVIPTGIKHGTVTVIYEGEPFEITTYRIDGSYTDSRRPDSVEFTKDLEEDLARRDFTMNAVAMNVRGEIFDPFGGRDDIKKGIIRCVGDPIKRFTEDALRILRGVRFASQLGFEIEKNTSEAVLSLRERLDNVSRERINVEMDKLLCGKSVVPVMLEYREIIACIIPEIRKSFDFKQYSHYHKYDVYEHTVRAIGNAEDDVLIRRTLLLHDIGKPDTFRRDENGVGHFKGHAQLGAKMAETILRNLRYDNKTIETSCELIFRHSDDILTEKNVRSVISKIGAENFFLLMKVKKADNSAKNPFVLEENRELEFLEATARKLVEENACMSISALEVNGKDMISLGLKGKDIGTALNELLEQVISETIKNQHDELIEYTRRNLI